MKKIHVWQVTEWDWVAAETSKQARRYFVDQMEVENNDELLKRVIKVTSEKMKKLGFWSDGKFTTFAQILKQMKKDKEEFPTLFATYDW